VTVLGSAIFNIAGLTFDGPLDNFWQGSAPPDPELLKAFRKVVLTQAQLNGSFFTEAGIVQGIEAAMERIDVAAVAPQVFPIARTEIPPASLAPVIIRN
jgi:capsular polysaccharide export protein